MKLKSISITAFVVLALLVSASGGIANALSGSSVTAPAAPQAAVGAGFTYQGQLKSGGSPVSGMCDFKFSLYEASSGGPQVGATQTLTNVTVANGVFTVVLNSGGEFGPAFTGEARYLGIEVSCPAGGGIYTPLTPRQPLTAAPYALSLRPTARISGVITGTLESPNGILKIDNQFIPPGYACNWAVGLRATQGGGSGVINFCDDTAVYGDSNYVGVLGVGVQYGAGGVAQSPYGFGLFGRADGDNGVGLYTVAFGSGHNYGIYAVNYSTEITGGIGIYGQKGYGSEFDIPEWNWYPGAVVGNADQANGVIGAVSGDSAVGVLGVITGTARSGVEGYGLSSVGYGIGVKGTSYAEHGTGVYGDAGSPYGFGVYGYSYDGTAIAGVKASGSGTIGGYYLPGVLGDTTTGNGVIGATSAGGGYGLLGVATGDNSTGVVGVGYGSGGYAGQFFGDVFVYGDLGASGTKSFRIDNPLDPANQYLYHYAVESPQVQNQYNGTALLDANGEAVVQLPAYFSAVNIGPFQYQLTAIGAPGPNLYIAQEVTGNEFKIAGGTPGMKVSWLVLGLRNDPWMRDNPHTDVVDKPASEQGKYVYPQGYGQPATQQVGPQQNGAGAPVTYPPQPGGPQIEGTPGQGLNVQPQVPNIPGSSTWRPQPPSRRR